MSAGAAISSSVSIIIADATAVKVILPMLIQGLSLNVSEAEWANLIYSLVFAALPITVGRVGDLFCRRRFLLIGITVFILASLIATAWLQSARGRHRCNRVVGDRVACWTLDCSRSEASARFW